MQIDLKPRRLKGLNFEMGRLVLGTMTFGSQVDQHETDKMVQQSRNAGITMFDTANVYSGGRSEEILGKIVKPFRSQIQFVSKVGSPKNGEPQLSPQSIKRELENSLRRLNTDYLDIYYLHAPDRNTPIEVTLACLDEIVRSGKARHVATSNYAAWEITEMNCLSANNSWPELRVCQQMYNLLARRLEDEYEECSRRLGLINIVYNPLAGGLLTGKHRSNQSPAAETRFTSKNYKDRYWNETQFNALESLHSIAANAGMTLIELALRWLLSRPLVDAILLGASSSQQLQTNLEACRGNAPDAETCLRIDEVWNSLRGVAPKYNR